MFLFVLNLYFFRIKAPYKIEKKIIIANNLKYDSTSILAQMTKQMLSSSLEEDALCRMFGAFQPARFSMLNERTCSLYF